MRRNAQEPGKTWVYTTVPGPRGRRECESPLHSYRAQNAVLGHSPRGAPAVTILRVRRAESIQVGSVDQAPEPGIAADNGRSQLAQSVATFAAFVVRLTLVAIVAGTYLIVAGVGWNWAQERDAVSEEPTPRLTPPTALPNALRAGPVATGVVPIDEALRGFLAGDVDAALGRLIVQEVPCGTLGWQGAPAISCVVGEKPGTVHELILSGCEPTWVTAETARSDLAALLADKPGLYAAMRGSSGYTAVLSWPDAPDRSLVLRVTPEGVTSYAAGCETPAAATQGHALELVSIRDR